MKWLVLIAVALTPTLGYSAIAIVSGAHILGQSANNDNVTTTAIDTTGCNFLVLSIARSDVVTVTDSKSNVWTPRTAYTTSGVNQQLYYSTAPVVGTNHTFTVSCTDCFPSIAVQGFSGVHLAPYDKESGFAATGVTTIQPGNLAPTEDNELLISGHTSAIAGAMSVDSGYTITDQGAVVGGLAYGVALAYIIKGAGTSGVNVNPTWTSPGSNTSMVSQAAFKAGAAVSSFPGAIINNPTERF